jgi:hypothetical protein
MSLMRYIGYTLVGSSTRNCTRTEGSSYWSSSAPTCQDIDECSIGTADTDPYFFFLIIMPMILTAVGVWLGYYTGVGNPCHYRSDCINTVGSYWCTPFPITDTLHVISGELISGAIVASNNKTLR